MSDDIVTWILTAGHRTTSTAQLLDQLCRHLVGRGIPLWRVSMSLATLHPQLLGFNLRWWRDRDAVEEILLVHGIDATPDFLGSPMRPTVERGETVRFRLEGGSFQSYPLLVSLHEGGATDYLASPLTLLNGWHQPVTWTTDRPGGFSADDVAALTDLLPALGVVVEAQVTRRLTGNLLDTYLGRTIGRHILSGEVQRRQGQELGAVLMATDLRGFTNLSDRLPAGELIGLLDDYFDAVVSPIHAGGGEVLKFVGDGLLAIFAPDAGKAAEAAGAALDAAVDALARLDTLNEVRQTDGRRMIRIGIGLHVGTVTYGNVGAVDRLDFTAIGPAVNLVCRLESLTKRIARPLLVSHEFAAICPRPLESLGFQPVRGFGEPEEVFGLPVLAPA
jgi:adenylate cyclase